MNDIETSELEAQGFTFVRSQHAPLYERYSMETNSFESVGEPGMYGPVDPETGAELKALVSDRGTHNGDYKIGSYYPHSTFVHGTDASGDPVGHDALEEGLRAIGHWTDALKPVMLPDGVHDWRPAFMFSPVEMAPTLDRVKQSLSRVLGEEYTFSLGSVGGDAEGSVEGWFHE